MSTHVGTPDYLSLASGASIAYRRRRGKPETAGGRQPGVVFLSGMNSDMTGTKASALDLYCAERGQAFLRFDYEGHGASSGKFEDGTIGTWLADALAVFDQLTEGPQILVGSSLGGWLMQLLTLRRPQRVAGLIGIASATDLTEELIWEKLPQQLRDKLLQDGRIARGSTYDPNDYVITRGLLEEGRHHLLFSGKIEISCPVRLFHGMADEVVPWHFSPRLAEHLTSDDVVVELIKGGDHRLSEPPQLERLAAAVGELSASGAVFREVST